MSPPAPQPGALDAARFQGGYDVRRSDAQNGGQSSYDGAVVVTLLDRDLVALLLPPGLSLAEPTTVGVTQHP